MFSRSFPLGPWLQSDKKEGTVSIRNSAQQAKAIDGGYTAYAGRSGENRFDLSGGFFGALQGSGVRKLNSRIEISLVLLRKERRRYFAA